MGDVAEPDRQAGPDGDPDTVKARDQPTSTKSANHERRRRALVAGVVPVLVEMSGAWLRAGRLGGKVVVRCRSGHVYTTIWIPGASVKSLRLGWWLPERDKRIALEHRDIRIP
jgi:hypothetical protein